jgi:glutathione synthase/RimK-type ligase-like ATP-grasp enzyme
MINSQRAFVRAIEKYCNRHGIIVEMRSQGWLVSMQRGAERRFAFGYDLGLNSAVAHRIANDKAAMSEVLEICGIPCIQHTLFLSPKLHKYIEPSGSWQKMLDLLRTARRGVVVKPNEGTGGSSVFKVTDESQLERAVHEIFSSENSLAISPYVEIENEVRVILIDYRPIVVYSKQRPSITADGKRTILELAIATIPVEQLPNVLSGMTQDNAALDEVLPGGERRALNWRHNLGAGAQPVLLEQGATRDTCVRMAQEAARSIKMRFGSIDVVLIDGNWQILEVNSGVMMEALGKSHPDLVDAAYAAALDIVFDTKQAQ